MVGTACAQHRAFPQELRSEIFSRIGRVIPLSMTGVSAPMSCAIWRIAGGTAEVSVLRPDLG